jgi:hypothetical protein
MNIGIIIPDRGDRPELLEKCLRMIKAQTINQFNFLKKFEICLVDHKPVSNECDITARYRKGYDYFRNKGFDILFLIENDDYYSPDYMLTMLQLWLDNGCKDIFGLQNTIYFHIGLRKYYTMFHRTRSSAMSTLIKPDLTFDWCVDHQPYTDIHLWSTIKNGLTVKSPGNICLGIKHGTGLCGGGMHTTELNRYTEDDSNLEFLKRNTDSESFKFYSNYKKNTLQL